MSRIIQDTPPSYDDTLLENRHAWERLVGAQGRLSAYYTQPYGDGVILRDVAMELTDAPPSVYAHAKLVAHTLVLVGRVTKRLDAVKSICMVNASLARSQDIFDAWNDVIGLALSRGVHAVETVDALAFFIGRLMK